VILDVAHNPHAAAHLAANLDSMGFFPETWAVCGVLGDKDIAGVLAPLAKRVDRWLFVDLPGARAKPAAEIAAMAIAQAGIEASRVETHASPRAALVSARQRVAEEDRIVVFGSFLTVGDVLAARGSARS
jgi:dihydrofolate synthase/folylpolyglutamate synthase